MTGRWRLGDLGLAEPRQVAALLEEQAGLLWRTLRWRVPAGTGPGPGISLLQDDRMLGFLPFRVSGDSVVLGGLFASRDGPAAAVEWHLLTSVLRLASLNPELRRCNGELLALTPRSAGRLRSLWPGQVRLRALMEVAWIGSGAQARPWLAPWEPAAVGPCAAVLDQAHAGDPELLADPAFANPEGYALLLERMVTTGSCGRFEPRASFLARDPVSGSLLGFVLAARMGEDQGHVLEVAVAPPSQGRGLGRGLLVHCLDALAGLGCRAVHLSVGQDHPAAIGLYRNLGFRRTHRFPDLRLRLPCQVPDPPAEAGGGPFGAG